MALVFEYEKDLDTGAQPYMSHEKDSTIYNYFVDNERALDRSAFVKEGKYDDVVFDNEERHLTTKAVSQIGIKNFPGIGGIGFFKDAYTEDSRIVAPIHVKPQLLDAPVLKTVEIVDGKLHVVIDDPDGLMYKCYRIVARQRYFATEYITYKADYYMDVPPVKGEYVVHCIGYDEDNGAISEESNELTLVVPTGNVDWAPHFEEVGDVLYELEELKELVENSTVDITDLVERVDAAEDNILLYADSIEEIEWRVNDAEQAINDLEERVETLEDALVGVEKLVDDINGEVV